MKVLVVDDSSTMRRIITNALNSFMKELEVIEAEDGLAGLEAYKINTDVELVLTDWNMPKMNGLELLKELIEAGCKVPIIMVTTEAEKTNVITAIRFGAKNYITKPFTPQTIQQKIQQTMSK